MKPHVIGLHHHPWGEDLRFPPPPSRDPIYLYRYAVWYKANPRDTDYMRTLFAERFPDGEWLSTDDPEWRQRITEADTLVLLYPDAIGLGFRPVERQIAHSRKAWADVSVLNGRRRQFRLSAGTRAGLRLRRLVERGMLLELLAVPLFVLTTPVLLAIDFARGRR